MKVPVIKANTVIPDLNTGRRTLEVDHRHHDSTLCNPLIVVAILHGVERIIERFENWNQRVRRRFWAEREIANTSDEIGFE